MNIFFHVTCCNPQIFIKLNAMLYTLDSTLKENHTNKKWENIQ